MTEEMGKPLQQAEAEVDKCGWVCEHYAQHAASYLADIEVEAKADRSVVVSRPLGGVFAVMPWNFPLWQVLRFAAPALMAGNAVLVKHAPLTMETSAALMDAARAAGIPSGVLDDIRIHESVVPEVIRHPAIAAVTVTGSERAGRAVASIAGAQLKKSVLELGGSDPFIVLSDADIERAVAVGVASRCLNNGQSCIAAKRFIVEAPIADEFVSRLTAAMAAKKMGDPALRDVDIGPLARRDLRDELARQVDETVLAGAQLRTGGSVPAAPGWFYPPTVLDDVPLDSPAAEEELFGPVAAVFRVSDVQQAIEVANRSAYGLSASVWTADRRKAAEIADRLNVGAVFVNDMSYSDPRLPFGGVGLSGYGRELGAAGISEFVNLQTRCFA